LSIIHLTPGVGSAIVLFDSQKFDKNSRGGREWS
jgi:hypothetical protein